MLIKQYDLRRELNLLRFGKDYIENVAKTTEETGKYDDKYIVVWKSDDGFISYSLKAD